MPLRDHFRPPASRKRSWEQVHGTWPTIIIQKLAPLLPSGYQAGPHIHLGSYFEIDIAAFEDEPLNAPFSSAHEDGAVATLPKADLSLETDIGDVSEYEVLIYDVAGEGNRLVAAIEIISPSNKDRDANRSQFVAKCAALLQQDVCVMLVDIVTIRRSNLYLELLGHLGLEDDVMEADDDGIYAVCLRRRQAEAKSIYDIWRRPLKIGNKLPTLPLWLSANFSIPIDFEKSYEETCQLLRFG